MSEISHHPTAGYDRSSLDAENAGDGGTRDAYPAIDLVLDRHSSDRAVPVFHGRVSDSPIVVELDNSAAMRLAKNSQGAARIPTIEAAYDRIVIAVKRLIENGLLNNSSRASEGHLHLRLSAIDLD